MSGRTTASHSTGAILGVLAAVAVIVFLGAQLMRPSEDDMPPDPFESDEVRAVRLDVTWSDDAGRGHVIAYDVGEEADELEINEKSWKLNTTARPGTIARVSAFWIDGNDESGDVLCRIFVNEELVTFDEGVHPDGCFAEVVIE